MDKTELLWVGTKYTCLSWMVPDPLCSSSPPLSTHVNMCACLVFSSRRIWVSTSTFPVSAVPASTSFANYDASGVLVTRRLRLHSCTPSWRHASITVMQCSPRHRRRQQTSFSACWMPLQGSSAIPGNTTKDCHDWCTRIYTGLTFLSESVTNFVYCHIDVSSGRLQCTCRTTVHQYPKLLHNTCVQQLVTGWWFRDIGSARTAVGHSLSLARWPSTLFNKTTFRRLLKTHFSPAIYTSSALEVKT